MIIIVSSFWWEMRKEIQSTQAHVVFFHVQNKMAPVDSRKQKLGILNHIIRERQRRKRIQQCIISMLTVRRKIIMSVCSHCLFFHVLGITLPELHLLENRDHVDGFQEIKVGGKTSGVITLRKDFKRPSEFLEQLFCIY